MAVLAAGLSYLFLSFYDPLALRHLGIRCPRGAVLWPRSSATRSAMPWACRW